MYSAIHQNVWSPSRYQYDKNVVIDAAIAFLKSEIGIKPIIGGVRSPATNMRALHMNKVVLLKIAAWERPLNRKLWYLAIPVLEKSMNSASHPDYPEFSIYEVAFGFYRAAIIRCAMRRMPKQDPKLEDTHVCNTTIDCVVDDVVDESIVPDLDVPEGAMPAELQNIFDSFPKENRPELDYLPTKAGILAWVNRFAVIIKSVRERQKIPRKQMLEGRDNASNAEGFKVGDVVMVKIPPIDQPDLEEERIGGTIVKVCGTANISYRMRTRFGILDRNVSAKDMMKAPTYFSDDVVAHLPHTAR